MINVIDNQKYSLSSIKYGIQWKIPKIEKIPIELKTKSLSNHILKTSEFNQGDSLSLNTQTLSVQNLIKKFETNSPIEKYLITRKKSVLFILLKV